MPFVVDEMRRVIELPPRRIHTVKLRKALCRDPRRIEGQRAEHHGGIKAAYRREDILRTDHFEQVRPTAVAKRLRARKIIRQPVCRKTLIRTAHKIRLLFRAID